MSNTMDSTRRKLALDSKVSRLQQCLLAERKARKGYTFEWRLLEKSAVLLSDLCIVYFLEIYQILSM